MNKTRTILLTSFIGLIILFFAGRALNFFEYYSIETHSNFPTLKEGEIAFISNLVSADRFDLICYKNTTMEYGKETWIHRICGMEGDKVQIKNGDLYVNGHYADKDLQLAHRYVADISQLKRIQNITDNKDISVQGDTIIVHLADKVVGDSGIKAARFIFPADRPDQTIYERYNRTWNVDNFGPIRVPRGMYFVLGDNRNASLDSRYLGFVYKDNVVGTVVW